MPFCLWMFSRVLRGGELAVMFHETFLPCDKASLKRRGAAYLQRLMAFMLVNSAMQVFASTGSGAADLERLCLRGETVQLLPVFSNIEPNSRPEKAAEVRAAFVSGDEVLVGHFGRAMAAVKPLVTGPLTALLRKNRRVKVLLIGECGETYRSALVHASPECEGRVIASGIRSADEISALLSACDLMFQPYPGGITTKRSSSMASLANGKFIVSNDGPETEELWRACGGVHLLTASDPVPAANELDSLVNAPELVRRASAAGKAFYMAHFSLDRTLDTLARSLQPDGAARVAAESPGLSSGIRKPSKASRAGVGRQ